jgi:hypothetical protein
MNFSILSIVILCLAAFSSAERKKDTLVLLDSLATRETHSIFFKNLQGKNNIEKASSSL